MSKNLVAVFIFSLALAACGNAKKSPDDPTKNPSGGGGLGNNLSPQQLKDQCTQTPNGSLSTDKQFCLVQVVSKFINKTQTGRVTILDNVNNGMYVISGGTAGAVDLLLDGHKIGDVNLHYAVNGDSGRLEFRVNLPSEAESSASVYSCFDHNMHPVWCNDDNFR